MEWMREGKKDVTLPDSVLRGALLPSLSSSSGAGPSLGAIGLGWPRTSLLASVPGAFMLGPPRVFPLRHAFPLLLIHSPF